MPFIPIPRGISLCFQFSLAGQQVEFCVTLQKKVGAVNPAVDFTDIDNVIVSNWATTFKPLQSTDCTMTQQVITDQSVEAGAQQIFTFAQTGTAASAALPSNAALVMSYRTAKRGRSFRGRSYLTGIPLSARNSATDITSTYAAAVALAIATLMPAIDTAGFAHVVASKQHNGVVQNPALVTPVTAYVVDGHFDSQRRRLFGRGT